MCMADSDTGASPALSSSQPIQAEAGDSDTTGSLQYLGGSSGPSVHACMTSTGQLQLPGLTMHPYKCPFPHARQSAPRGSLGPKKVYSGVDIMALIQRRVVLPADDAKGVTGLPQASNSASTDLKQ